MAILLRGVFLGMKHAARVMIPQKAGCILSLSSTAGVNGGLGPHVYSAAIHGVIGLTKSVGSELAKYGIRVNAVAPGNIATEMTSSLMTGDPGQSEKTAEFIAAMSPAIAGTIDEIYNVSDMIGLPSNVSDPLDVPAYFAGCFAAYLGVKAIRKKLNKKNFIYKN